LLRRLERVRDEYSGESSEQKLGLLRQLECRRLRSDGAVHRLHEVLSFLHAYPDDRRVHAQVERMLEAFSGRSDLRRFADDLADTGIAGTPTHYSFGWHMVRWLQAKWPGSLSVDWELFEKGSELWGLLYGLLPFTESLALDEADLDVRELLEFLKGPGETDADFLIGRVADSLGNDETREIVYEDMNVPCILSSGEGTPSRTGARYRTSRVVFQNRPLNGTRPDVVQASATEPDAVRSLSVREARKIIDMARSAMVARSRDLYAFEHADESDVRLVDFGDGLQFAAIGMRPDSRLVLDTVYGFLTLKNGVPIGYVLTRSYADSTEVAYNVFETFRGGESGQIYGKVLAMTRHLFGARVFAVEPYQLGHENDEGLDSGAWWFYYKLGFRPKDPGVKKLVRSELARMRRSPRHRSSHATLNELSSVYMFYELEPTLSDGRGVLSLEHIGLHVSKYLGQRFGADRDRATVVCEREAAQLLGLRSFRGFTDDERMVWRRWSPLVLVLPGVRRWSAVEKNALVEVAKAKGGRQESEFLPLFAGHSKLRTALLELAEG
jgi:hypothetical protein